MQIFGTATSPVRTGIGVGTGASKYTDLVNQYAQTLASGSKASLDDQLSAYQNVMSLVLSGDGELSGNDLYNANKNDFNRAVDLVENSDMSKRVHKVDCQFSAAPGPALDCQNDTIPQVIAKVAQNQLDTLSRFSQDDQKIIFVALNMNVLNYLTIGGKQVYSASLDDWKADLKKQAATLAAQPIAPDDAASANATVTAVTAAVAGAYGGQSTAKTASDSMVALLPKDAASITGANIALQTLLKFQDERDAQKLAAAALTAKTGTAGVQNYAGSKTNATPQKTSSNATSALPADHLNQLA